MLILGLTGSIGMGKSATAAMFRECGVAVDDADATVHALYRGKAVGPVEAAFPGVAQDGAIDRARLGARVFGDAAALKRLEDIVHPLVRAERDAFLAGCRAAGRRLAALDVPLLFETGAERDVDAIVVVSADASVQKARVLARPGMTETRLMQILARQTPDSQKRARAHFVIDTGHGFAAARRQVAALLRAVAGMQGKD